MKLRVVTRVVSAILFTVGIAMFTSVIVSILMRDNLNVTLALLYSSIITTLFGASALYSCIPPIPRIGRIASERTTIPMPPSH